MKLNSLIRHRLDNIEDVEEFYSAIKRSHLTKDLSDDHPYTYWTIELYDQDNGIRGGGGLGVLAADTRRVAEQMGLPFTLITPFYPTEAHQNIENGQIVDTHRHVEYRDYDFSLIDNVHIKCNGDFCRLDVIEKVIGSTRIIAITEPNFGELYQGESGSDHRLYQEVALGFGGYQALKLVGLKPAIMQLNEVATFFAALARLDELASSGMDFYEAVVYTRKHTLYTNHTLVQAAEAEFSYEQFERYVFPNLKSKAVIKWLRDKFEHDHIRLSSVTIEIAELKSGVSELHARVANYRDLAGEKVKFKAITNGIDMNKWVAEPNLKFFKENKILDKFYLPAENYAAKIDESLTAEKIRELKAKGRAEMNSALSHREDHKGRRIFFENDELVFVFKRRFVDYKRPWLPFSDPRRLAEILEKYNAHYILTGRIHSGDSRMVKRLGQILETVEEDPILRERVHYLADYDEQLAAALSKGCNVAVNLPIVGLEACGTSWMKDIANFELLVSTHDGGVADAPASSYLSINAKSETREELTEVYDKMDTAAAIWASDYDLEYWIARELKAYLPIISGTRMLKDYLEFLFN